MSDKCDICAENRWLHCQCSEHIKYRRISFVRLEHEQKNWENIAKSLENQQRLKNLADKELECV